MHFLLHQGIGNLLKFGVSIAQFRHYNVSGFDSQTTSIGIVKIQNVVIEQRIAVDHGIQCQIGLMGMEIL